MDVPVAFFFEGILTTLPLGSAKVLDPSLVNMSRFAASSEGLRLMEAFMKIKNVLLKRDIAQLVERLAQKGEK